MTCVENKFTDSKTHSTSHDHVGKIMLVSRESRDAYGAGNSIRSYLHGASMFVFVGDDGCDCPCLRAVTGRERAAAVKKFTTLNTVEWSRALRDFLERAFHNHAIDQRFSTQQSRLSRSIIFPGSPDQIESPGDRAQAIY